MPELLPFILLKELGLALCKRKKKGKKIYVGFCEPSAHVVC